MKRIFEAELIFKIITCLGMTLYAFTDKTGFGLIGFFLNRSKPINNERFGNFDLRTETEHSESILVSEKKSLNQF